MRLAPDSGRIGRLLVLLAAGLLAAFPFLTRNGVGTGEAYNYSLAVADAIAQMRAGELPVLAGQTEYAFNGRIHPLRNAPYLFYLCRGIDLLTFERLGAWQLQNLSLAASLVALFFAAYGSLRWGAGCGPRLALFLACAYGLSPALLAGAHAQNLFMTVHAAVFVPVAIGAAVRSWREIGLGTDLVLGTAVAALWLAHPPIALWTGLAAATLRLWPALRRPGLDQLAGLAAAALSFAFLSCFVFASVLALREVSDFAGAAPVAGYGGTVERSLRQAFPGALLPVSLRGIAPGDLQLGYVGWILLLLSGLAAVRGRREANSPATPLPLLAAGAGVLLLLLLPLPGLTARLWDLAPAPVAASTNIWPMQRLYLVATGLIVYAAAFALPRQAFRSPLTPRGAALIAAGWLVVQALPLVGAGLRNRWTESASARSHLPANVDLTVTSYSFLGVPPGYTDGAMDPSMGFRFLVGGKRETGSSFTSALAAGTAVLRRPVTPGEGIVKEKLLLQPALRYVMTVTAAPPFPGGEILATGKSLSRRYSLAPVTGGGVAAEPGAPVTRHYSLWTDQREPEEVELQVMPPPTGGAPGPVRIEVVSHDPARLPVRLRSLLPFRIEVDAPAPNLAVETPRRYLPGYRATVNGADTRVFRSPAGSTMVAVPQGRSVVEMRFEGPSYVRHAFWLTAASWCALALGGLFVLARRKLGSPPAGRPFTGRRSRRVLSVVAGTTVVAVLTFTALRSTPIPSPIPGTAGPLQITTYLPLDREGRSEPILTTGRKDAGSVVYVNYVDDTHIKVGIENWGVVQESGPIETNYLAPQEFVVDSGALHPPGGAARGIAVELNGRPVVSLPDPAHPSTREEITVGRSRIQNSTTDPAFNGEIVATRRLSPVHRHLAGPGETVRMQVTFPAEPSAPVEPLLTIAGGAEFRIDVNYLPGGDVRLGYRGAAGATQESAPLSLDRDRPHTLELAAAGTGPVTLSLDGKPVLERLPFPTRGRVSFTWGRRFSGVVSPLGQSGEAAATEGAGAYELALKLPANRTGKNEPLLSTGRNGKGDLVYLTYIDASRIRATVDHWGIGAVVGEPVEVDFAREHRIVISIGSLFPAGDPRHERAEISLDGRRIAEGPLSGHPTTPDEIVPGRNTIGNTNAEPEFTGELLSVQRLPP